MQSHKKSAGAVVVIVLFLAYQLDRRNKFDFSREIHNVYFLKFVMCKFF